MLTSEVTRWLDSFDSDKPVSYGDHANAWVPVWEDQPVQAAKATQTDEQEEFYYYGS